MFRCEKCKCEWGEGFGEVPVCSYREPEKKVFCTDDKCVQGHDCTSGCGNDYDCPCLTEHDREEDYEPASEVLEKDVIQPAKDYMEKYNGHV